MKTWTKAIGIACLVELLLAVGFAMMHFANSKKLIQGLLNCLTMYHMFSISLAFSVLNVIWAWPGPGREPIRTSYALLYVLVFVFQVMLTTPVVYLLLRWINRRSHNPVVRQP